MSVNKVILLGNLGKDPEIRTTQDGKEVANFSIATSESWKDKSTGQKQTKTEWHKVVVFQSGLASIVKKYLKKGSKVYIEGQLQTRKWTDKLGVDKYSTEVVLQGFNGKLDMLDSVRQELQPGDSNNQPIAECAKPEDLDDEIPF